MSGVARLVGAQRTLQNNGNVKSEPKYLACEESPIRAFYFWTLVLLSLSWHQRWTDFFAFLISESAAVSCIQHSFMHLTLQIHTLWRASRAVLPVLHCQEMSYQRNAHIKQRLSFWAWVWPQIDIPKQYCKLTFLSVTDMYVCAYIHTSRE